MTDPNNAKRKGRVVISAIVVFIVALMVTGAGFALKYLLNDSPQRRTRQVQMISMVNPPPPPKIKEKPPEPEVKKEEIIEQQPEDIQPEPVDDQAQDEPPPGDDLAVDADGSAGSDSFGLLGKKGGRALIGGSGSEASLIRRYAWYTRIIQEELRKRMNRHMEENGGIPDGDLKALIQIKLDDDGRIVDFDLARSSGNTKMDDALFSALKLATISEPPPSGMPRVLKLKISAKG